MVKENLLKALKHAAYRTTKNTANRASNLIHYQNKLPDCANKLKKF